MQLLVTLSPGLKEHVELLRCILGYIHIWDPSTHGLLGVKHLLAALRSVGLG